MPRADPQPGPFGVTAWAFRRTDSGKCRIPGLWPVVKANGSSEKGTPMAYIDHIAPVRATGPIDVPSGPARLLPAWAMATWLVR